jgi:hypothetical protein
MKKASFKNKLSVSVSVYAMSYLSFLDKKYHRI